MAAENKGLSPKAFMPLEPGEKPAPERKLTPEERRQRYAEAVLKKYDADGNKQLDEQEQAKMRRRPPESADKNEDGQLSLEELVEWLKE